MAEMAYCTLFNNTQSLSERLRGIAMKTSTDVKRGATECFAFKNTHRPRKHDCLLTS
jgi:hypothetical protein